MKLILSILICFVFSVCPALERIQIYYCPKCGGTRHCEAPPPSRKGKHEWRLLGNWGDEVYLCCKCKLLIRTEQMPSAFYCKSGGNHEWTHLGKKGYHGFVCSKCNILTYLEKQPEACKCPLGGEHDWQKPKPKRRK